ncbi:WxL domain-containing protein [Paenibacillus sp. L3-i20]|uniref:WxL domain-containing protein n=1 Tax=Paenibacillus sp. L3-i20 TaxID=2905833 RepID=UPI001EDF9EEB|nr:WxL domain-containing protein [Paenibacillus sp. L3-i20]GKU77612.1 hypothetical protein L3i20_v220090 [Paenibacillus sp. L3-i20]
MRMKVIRVLLVFSLILTVITPMSVFATANIVDNGGFESFTSGSTADGWKFSSEGSPASFIAEVSSASVSEGIYSQRLSHDGTTLLNQKLEIGNNINTGFTAGQPVKFTFKANVTSLVWAKLRAKVEFYNVAGQYIGRGVVDITSSTSGFSEFELTTVLPAETDHITVKFESIITADGGYYNLYLDDVKLNKVLASGNQTQVGVLSGELEFSTISGSFLNVDLDNEAVMRTNTTSTVRISDNRGTGAGWAVKISATDFLSASLPDPSSAGNASFVLKIPISSLSLESSNIDYVSGQPIDPVNGPLAASFTVSNASQTVVRAQPGFGMGAYNVPIHYTLVLPKALEIASQSGTGSKFSTGQLVGTRAGFYTATLNFTIGEGL